jgi:hypothetical protein
VSAKAIPPNLQDEVLARAGEGLTAPQIAVWLAEAKGVQCSSKAVQRLLARVTAERRPLVQAVVSEKLSKSVATDLDAVDGILDRARKDEQAAGDTEDLAKELERIAMVDIGKAFGPAGGLLPLAEMPEDVRRAISSVEIEGSTRSHGELTKVKFWDKVRGLELVTKLRARLMTREVALKARDQQLRALALRLELSGANGKLDDGGDVRARLLAKLDAEELAED